MFVAWPMTPTVLPNSDGELLGSWGRSDCNMGSGQHHHGVLSKAGGRTPPYNPAASSPTEPLEHGWGLDAEVFLEPGSLPTIPSWSRILQAVHVHV